MSGSGGFRLQFLLFVPLLHGQSVGLFLFAFFLGHRVGLGLGDIGQLGHDINPQNIFQVFQGGKIGRSLGLQMNRPRIRASPIVASQLGGSMGGVDHLLIVVVDAVIGKFQVKVIFQVKTIGVLNKGIE